MYSMQALNGQRFNAALNGLAGKTKLMKKRGTVDIPVGELFSMIFTILKKRAIKRREEGNLIDKHLGSRRKKNWDTIIYFSCLGHN